MKKGHLFLLAMGAAVAVACSDSGSSTAPNPPLSGVLGGTNGGKDTSVTTTGGNGGGNNGGSTGGSGGDTTIVSTTTPGVHGRVFEPSGTSSDTTIYVIVPGVQVQIMTQPAAGDTPALVATVTTDATGYFKLDPIPDGTYEARAIAPAGSTFAPAEAFNILVKNGLMVGYSEVNLVFTGR